MDPEDGARAVIVGSSVGKLECDLRFSLGGFVSMLRAKKEAAKQTTQHLPRSAKAAESGASGLGDGEQLSELREDSGANDDILVPGEGEDSQGCCLGGVVGGVMEVDVGCAARDGHAGDDTLATQRAVEGHLRIHLVFPGLVDRDSDHAVLGVNKGEF